MSARVPHPWRILSSEPPLDYRIFKLRQYRVADPRNGAQHDRVVIEAPDWANIIPITPDQQVVMIRQFRFGIGANTLEIPGGVVEPGEEPGAAASRELEEETGYRAGQVLSLGAVHPNPANQSNRCHCFLAIDCQKVSDGAQEAGEDIAVELYDRSEIPAMIHSGQITHSLVLAAFFFEQLLGRSRR